MSGKIILLVEDNPSDIALTQRALAHNRTANRLVVVTDGVEALEYLHGSGQPGAPPLPPLPSLTLLDLNLPRLDGIEVLRRLRAHPRTRRLPVVILTSSKEQDDLAQSYDNGANSYIRKPVDFEQFSEAVRQLELYWLVLNEPPP